MWNEKTQPLVADGKLVVIGVIQEQHGERCRLYSQWKEYRFPIVQDAGNELGLAVVPVPVLIDEHGVVVSNRPRVSSIAKLVNNPSRTPDRAAPTLNRKHDSVDWLAGELNSNPDVETLCSLGDASLQQGSAESVRDSIRWYQKALAMKELELAEKSWLRGAIYFRLGVAYRTRFDSKGAESNNPADFTAASENWAKALAENPNQYIWRRRIQQYGPRQIKPYPFYDWIKQAQKDIQARGEVPTPLSVALTGSEIALPERAFTISKEPQTNPDPNGEITRDQGKLARIHPTVVPPQVAPGKTVRVHLRIDPVNSLWNNESEELVVWINDSQAGAVSTPRLSHPNMKEPSSSESRTIEFEFKTDDKISKGASITGYVLYYVCESEQSQCLFRRQDFSIPIPIDQ